MSILDILRINKIKAELDQVKMERDSYKKTLSETNGMDYLELKKAIALLEEQNNLETQKIKKQETTFIERRQALEQQIKEVDNQIASKKNELVILDEEILLQSFGFYIPRYELQNSEAYKAKLEQIRDEQEKLVKLGKAAYCTQNWTVNNSQKEGERVMRDYVKLILRSFNNECDASIIAVKFSNIDAIEKKIRKAHETLNKLGQRMSIVIATDYLNLKLKELYLCYEYQNKKQQEKEEQKRLRDQMREEAKVLKEIEDMKLKLEKEEKHFGKALETINSQLLSAKTDIEKEALEKEKTNILKKMTEIEKEKLDILNREQNTRAGYVYIISNIGSFGENVYKIGVTRRLDPSERVDELGGASVPFDFDIHAMIFSEDAPVLETALHKAFDKKRLNMINMRREFFSATLDEIEKEVKTNFNKPYEFIRLADAPEYRQSLKMRNISN